MIRAFETSTLRHQISLEGLWHLTVGERGYSAFVPGCWETIPGLESYRGKVMYERSVTCGGNLLFSFSGVSHTADVWLDEQYLCRHEGAYTSFSFAVSEVPRGKHRLRVAVDNAFSDHHALSIPNDYMTYGGITRACQVEETSDLWLSSLHLVPEKEDEQWFLNVSVQVCAHKTDQGALRCEVNGHTFDFGSVTTDPGHPVEMHARIPVPDAEVYELNQPVLTYVRCVLSLNGVDIDDLIERTGLRTVEALHRQLLFNGKPVRLLGFNRHEDHAIFGSAIPPAAMMQDIQLIRDMGGNAVRTCHYPNDPYFLDLCDENGMMVWEESHARGLNREQMLHPMFMPQSRQCIDEMVSRDINHPAIILWGLLNECASDADQCRPMYEELIARIRMLDSSRPVTFATCRPGSEVFGSCKHPAPGFSDGDQCLDLCDVVSFNSYPGWYHNAPCSDFLRRVREWAEGHQGDDKPYIVSEIGAGAIYGFRSRIQDKWSEERQATILRDQLTAVLADQKTCGVFIWQFADCRVSSECFYGRPRTMNNKGIVDEYRRPKLAYDVVRELFTSQWKNL